MTEAFQLVFNANAGAVLKAGREAISAAVEQSGLACSAVHFLDGNEIVPAMRDLKKSGPLLLGGGDGTLMRGATEFFDTPGRLGILPMGTMNLFAQDLGLPADLQGALNAYAGGTKKRTIDVGMVNGKPFLCFASLGFVPEAAELREENRNENDFILISKLAMFIFPKLDPAHRLAYRMRIDGKQRTLRAAGLIISNNLLKEEGEPHAHAFAKESLRQGTLGVYSLVPRTFWDKIRLMARVQIGHWKNDPVLVERVAQTVQVHFHRGKEKVSLDGEMQEMRQPLKFSIKPKALTLLVPREIPAEKKAENKIQEEKAA